MARTTTSFSHPPPAADGSTPWTHPSLTLHFTYATSTSPVAGPPRTEPSAGSTAAGGCKKICGLY
ncbi:uncharacterized protein SCHCODRAFT_02270232 [Schizophyllum commune H4-8]|uniref:uncharacterized protein n=1 Tax=Schizophyllum commune (strain H4-8 / FGSC 9210) TaxID=578458 RepID=UPI002160E789|nr:uncharacterized protein SCHCODRAFT_02270232 [Schizophyllum commune H4-8]KAI5894137.1 hypothetical protein SCHCODRAFT_02270232 [Schizophyllum commune H4-8]